MLEARLPFHRHLKWLCLEGLSYEDVKSYYDNIQMAIPTQVQYQVALAGVEGLLMPPMTKRRLERKIYNADDLAVWEKYGYGEIYLHQMEKSDWSEIGRILNHPVMRVALECCLAAKLTHDEISQLLPSVYSLPLNTQSILTYISYFFDHEIMKKSDWQSYLNQISEDRYTHTRLFFALTRTQEEVLHAVGLPTRAQFGTMLKNVMNTANYRFEHYARQQSPESQEEARKWARLMMDAGVRHEKFGSTDATDFSKLIQTQFEYIDDPIETVTPEMLAEAKPPTMADEKAVNAAAPSPPATEQQERNPNDI
jgi:hypothetical protein